MSEIIMPTEKIGGGGNYRTLCANCTIYRYGKVRIMIMLGVVISDWLTALKNMTTPDIDCPRGTFESCGLVGQSGSNRWEPIAYMSGSNKVTYANMVYFPTPTSITSKEATLNGSGAITYGDNTIRDMQVWGQFIYTV